MSDRRPEGGVRVAVVGRRGRRGRRRRRVVVVEEGGAAVVVQAAEGAGVGKLAQVGVAGLQRN